MINYLLDQPYIKLEDFPNAPWTDSVDSVSSHSCMGELFLNHLMMIERQNHQKPFIFKKHLVNTNHQLVNFLENYLNEIEDYLLTGIFYSTFWENGHFEFSEQFNKMNLPQKVVFLEINSYLSNRNLMDLYNYLKLLEEEMKYKN